MAKSMVQHLKSSARGYQTMAVEVVRWSCQLGLWSEQSLRVCSIKTVVVLRFLHQRDYRLLLGAEQYRKRLTLVVAEKSWYSNCFCFQIDCFLPYYRQRDLWEGDPQES